MKHIHTVLWMIIPINALVCHYGILLEEYIHITVLQWVVLLLVMQVHPIIINWFIVHCHRITCNPRTLLILLSHKTTMIFITGIVPLNSSLLSPAWHSTGGSCLPLHYTSWVIYTACGRVYNIPMSWTCANHCHPSIWSFTGFCCFLVSYRYGKHARFDWECYVLVTNDWFPLLKGAR